MTHNATRLRHRRSPAKLLALLSEASWLDLKAHLNLPDEVTRNVVLKRPALLHGTSNTELIERIMAEAAPAFAMMRDVTLFLDRHAVSARTTGEVLNLSEVAELTAQQKALIASWGEQARGRLAGERGLEGLWNAASEALENLSADSFEEGARRPTERRGWLELRQPEPQQHGETLRLYVEQLDRILAVVPESDGDELLERIVDECSRRLDEARERQTWDDTGFVPPDDHVEDARAVAAFVERLAVLADLERSADLQRVMALSAFRSLPQLFEAWLLCFILGTAENAGHTVTLERTAGGEWDLKYAGDRKPVARIYGVGWMFFQFKRPGAGAMPDLAVFERQDGSGPARLVLDAKMSELRGYTAAAYRSTHSAYSKLGGHVLVLEHEERNDADGVAGLIHTVQPGGVGERRLREELFMALHGPTTAIALIDLSASYADRLDEALERLAAVAAQGHLASDYVAFAGSARIGRDLVTDMRRGVIGGDVGTGTRLGPLRDRLEELRADGKPLELVLLGDGAFDDGELRDLMSTGDLIWLWS
jgi:hypothetical protein